MKEKKEKGIGELNITSDALIGDVNWDQPRVIQNLPNIIWN